MPSALLFSIGRKAKDASIIDRQIADLQLIKSRVEHRCAQLEQSAAIHADSTAVSVEQVKRQSLLLQEVAAPYTLEEVSIATKLAGRIEKIMVDEGDFITPGQQLALMQTNVLRAQLAQAEAQRNQAEKNELSSRAQIQVRCSELEAAKATVLQKESKLDGASKSYERFKKLFKADATTQQKLEDYFKDMQDLEFTIQDNKLWLLQTRNGKRTGAAMVKIAMDLLRAGEIDEKTVLRRMEPQKLDELLHPVFDKDDLKRAKTVAKGLPASPGAATGQIVFFADDAEAWSEMKKKVIMVRIETSPEDLRGMSVAQGIMIAAKSPESSASTVGT